MASEPLQDNELDRRFLQLACRGPLGELKKMLAKHPELLETRWDQRTVLSEACRWPDSGMCVPFLLEAGADPNASRLDDPQFRPLRLALHNGSPHVPLLLQHGATPKGVYPGQYRSDSAPDVIVAAWRCPQHIPALLAAGANPHDRMDGDHDALGHLLGHLARQGPDKSTELLAEHSWKAIEALLGAGARFEGKGFHGPAWFDYWKVRFSQGWLSDAAQQSIRDMLGRIDDPGIRHEGKTFLHAIAEQLQGSKPGEYQQEWQKLVALYGPELVGKWLHLTEDAQENAKSVMALVLPKAPKPACGDEMWRWHIDRLDAALQWVGEFSKLGMDPNVPGKDGLTVAQRIASVWPWFVLEEPRICQQIKAIGLDLTAGTERAGTPVQLFIEGARHPGWRKPEPGEIEALALAVDWDNPATKRTMMRL